MQDAANHIKAVQKGQDLISRFIHPIYQEAVQSIFSNTGFGEQNWTYGVPGVFICPRSAETPLRLWAGWIVSSDTDDVFFLAGYISLSAFGRGEKSWWWRLMKGMVE